jgi:2-hydroxyacyl-CoA lyase 1
VQIGNASVNAFPLLVLGGSSETLAVTYGGFQELDAVSLLRPHTKLAVQPASKDPAVIVAAIRNAYRVCWYGRPGPAFVDLPTDLIMTPSPPSRSTRPPPITVLSPPKPLADPTLICQAAKHLRSASAPLVIVGKGSAYDRAEGAIRRLVQTHHLPFLPTPMGKGVVPDSHPLNVSSARSAALKHADTILILGARLNWILHFGEAPRYRADVKIIQVDVSPEELGRANSRGEPALSILGDIGLVVDQLDRELGNWKALSFPSVRAPDPPNDYVSILASSADKNEQKSNRLATTPTPAGAALGYERAYHVIRSVLDDLSPPDRGEIVYTAEGANTMDVSRGSFPLEHPRRRLDAGTWGTMGVGMGYAIAAWAAHNLPGPDVDAPIPSGVDPLAPANVRRHKKKIVALEGDSAFGFSGMEIETMARHKMDIVVIVMNNSGIYKGDATDEKTWKEKQTQTTTNDTAAAANVQGPGGSRARKGLRGTSLLYETRYDALANMVGGKGYFIRTEAELAQATKEAFLEQEKVCVLNVIIDPGLQRDTTLGWLDSKEKHAGTAGTGQSDAGGREGQSKL